MSQAGPCHLYGETAMITAWSSHSTCTASTIKLLYLIIWSGTTLPASSTTAWRPLFLTRAGTY